MADDVHVYKEEKFIQSLPIIDRENANVKYTEKEEKWLREMVSAEFTNNENQHLGQKFFYGTTKKNFSFNFFPGGKYRLPRFIVNHLNNCGTPIYKWQPDGSGKIQKTFTHKKRRFTLREVYTA